MVPHDGVERIVIQLVVVAVIAECGGALGIIAEIRLVLLVEESVLRRQAVSQSFGLLGRKKWSKGSQKEDGKIPTHSSRRLSKRRGGVKELTQALALSGGQIGVRDPIVPAKGVLVQKKPRISHSERSSRQIASQNTPAAQGSGSGRAIKARQFQSGEP